VDNLRAESDGQKWGARVIKAEPLIRYASWADRGTGQVYSAARGLACTTPRVCCVGFPVCETCGQVT